MTQMPEHAGLQVQKIVDFSTSVQGHHMAAGGPDGPIDIVLVLLSVLIVLVVSVYAIKFLIKPREKDPEHIKRRILRDDF